MILGVSLFSQDEQFNANHDVKVVIKMKDNSLKGSMSASFNPLNSMPSAHVIDLNGNIVEDGMSFNVKSASIDYTLFLLLPKLKLKFNIFYQKGKIEVNLFYHFAQNKSRINYFIQKVRSINNNILFNDISSLKMSQLEDHITNVTILQYSLFLKTTYKIFFISKRTLQHSFYLTRAVKHLLAPATVVNVTIYPSVGVTQLRAFLKDCI